MKDFNILLNLYMCIYLHNIRNKHFWKILKTDVRTSVHQDIWTGQWTDTSRRNFMKKSIYILEIPNVFLHNKTLSCTVYSLQRLYFVLLRLYCVFKEEMSFGGDKGDRIKWKYSRLHHRVWEPRQQQQQHVWSDLNVSSAQTHTQQLLHGLYLFLELCIL